ncbi:ABC transporter ATP-binding protein [Candidatus Woesearchaeota archaeon]|nr:ABC transporter ATP-binding protein [Candidatus Woesearchaeota archaeon]
MGSRSIISVSNLKMTFGKMLVLKDVNLEIEEGEIFGVVGLSGSGKTTFLNLLAGVLEPDSGDVKYRLPEKPKKKKKKEDKKAANKPNKAEQEDSSMKSVRKKPLKVRQVFGFAAQEPSFYMQLTVKENLNYFSSMYGMDRKTRKENIETVLGLVGLDNFSKLRAGQLSGGMKKRLDIACSMVHNPRVLILDEPTSDLDPLLREQMMQIIRKININGTTVIVASHFLKDMERLCNRIGILHNNTIGTIGTPDHIKRLYTKNDEIHIETFPGKYDDITKKLQHAKGAKISKIVNLGHKLVIYTPEAIKVMHHVLEILQKSDEHLIDIDLAKPTLREVFETLVKGDKSG